MKPILNLGDAKVSGDPFPHFYLADVMDAGHAAELVTWLEKEAPWEPKRGAFYDQHEFLLLPVVREKQLSAGAGGARLSSAVQVDLPASLRVLHQRSMLDVLCAQMGRLFGRALEPAVRISAHRLKPGQTVGVHNDFLRGEESCRLLVQLNRGWRKKQGGALALFSGPKPEELRKVIYPRNRCAIGFAISEKSFHAVSPVHAGERFTLVYSFFDLAKPAASVDSAAVT